MKKSLLSILAIMLVMVFVLTGCQDVTDGTDTDISAEDTSEEAVTLNFYIVTSESTTDEAKKAVQDAFNAITEIDYYTHIEFVFCTPDEYRDILDAKMAAVDAKGGYSPDEIEVDTEDTVTVVDDIGYASTAYPELSETQVDIVFINSYEMLTSYANASIAFGSDEYSYLLDIKKYVSDDYKALKTYIFGNVLESAYLANRNGENGPVTIPNSIYFDPDTMAITPYTGSIYAIPNNSLIGNYTYLLVNKELATEFYYNENDFFDFTTDASVAFANYIYEKYGNSTDICPMLAPYEYPMMVTWGSETASSLTITPYRTAETVGSTKKTAVNAFTNNYYSDWNQIIANFNGQGYFAVDPVSQEKYGLAIVEGSYADRNLYSDDYYVKILDYPRVEEEDVFGSMFGISSFTANADRAMQIIAALSTNSELINILQYGIEGIHYNIEDDGSLKRLNDDYVMEYGVGGNMLLAYPDEGVDPISWYGSISYQNRDARLSTIFGFDAFCIDNTIEKLRPVTNEIELAFFNITDAELKAIDNISEKYLDKLDNCKSSEEYNALVQEVKAALSADAAASSYINKVNRMLDIWYNYVFYYEEEE